MKPKSEKLHTLLRRYRNASTSRKLKLISRILPIIDEQTRYKDILHTWDHFTHTIEINDIAPELQRRIAEEAPRFFADLIIGLISDLGEHAPVNPKHLIDTKALRVWYQAPDQRPADKDLAKRWIHSLRRYEQWYSTKLVG